MNSVKFYVEAGAKLPVRKNIGDVGYDISAFESTSLDVGETKVVKTGVWSQGLPDGVEVQVRPRSGLSAKGILTILGTVDSGYTGEIGVIVHNLNNYPVNIGAGDRIAQLVFNTVLLPEVIEVGSKDVLTSRGANGFGSTGV